MIPRRTRGTELSARGSKSRLDIPVSRLGGALKWARKNPQGPLDAPFSRLLIRDEILIDTKSGSSPPPYETAFDRPRRISMGSGSVY